MLNRMCTYLAPCHHEIDKREGQTRLYHFWLFESFGLSCQRNRSQPALRHPFYMAFQSGLNKAGNENQSDSTKTLTHKIRNEK